MRRAASQPLLRHFLKANEEEGDDFEGEEKVLEFRSNGNSVGKVTCTTLHKRDPKRPCEKYVTWKQGQKVGAARLKKQLKSRWAIQKLIDEQLTQFHSHYSRALAPTRMSDVAQIIMPKWVPAYELTAVSWLGDWRPSTILELLRSLSHFLWDTGGGVDHALSQLINDVRIEEAVIDEEMTEIQSNCVLHLPFGRIKTQAVGPPMPQIKRELKKTHRVIVKAQNLRMTTLELVVKKVLSQTDAAEFLVAFVGIQDTIHEFSMKYKARVGPVCIKDPRVSSPLQLEHSPCSCS